MAQLPSDSSSLYAAQSVIITLVAFQCLHANVLHIYSAFPAVLRGKSALITQTAVTGNKSPSTISYNGIRGLCVVVLQYVFFGTFFFRRWGLITLLLSVHVRVTTSNRTQH